MVVSKPPSPLSRPPVIGYNISHNTTGSIVFYQTNCTILVIDDVVPGVYLFTVLAVNVLGDGKATSITLTITGV